MNILAIDSSTKTFTLAVARDEKILVSRAIRLKNVLSCSILPAIDRILKDSRVSLKKLDGLVVGLGPGSFTGLRVGVATVKGLAFAANIPVVGISSLDAIALNVADKAPRQVAVVTDARRQLIYACLFRKQGRRLVRKTPYLLVSPAEFLDTIQGDVIFAGDALGLYEDEIKSRAGKNGFQPSFAREKDWLPQAANLVPAALERFRQRRTDPVDKLNPLYLYPKDCQVRNL